MINIALNKWVGRFYYIVKKSAKKTTHYIHIIRYMTNYAARSTSYMPNLISDDEQNIQYIQMKGNTNK